MRGAIIPDGRPVRFDRCIRLTLLVVAVSVAVVSCSKRNMEAIGETDTPFVFLLSPAHEANTADLETLAAFLTDQSGLAVEVRVADDHDHAITSAGTPYFDAFLLPLFDYLFCHQEYDVEAGLQVLRHGNVQTYRGDILVKGDSDVHELADLAGQQVAFVDRYSTSGFLYPAKLLREEGVAVESSYAGTHDAALEELIAGRVAAAAAYHGATAEGTELRVLATTDEIPNEPVFFRQGLDADKRADIINALILFAATEDGRRVLVEMADITGFLAIDDEYYRAVHEDIDAAEQRIQDLVPGGWLLHNENQLTLDQYAP